MNRLLTTLGLWALRKAGVPLVPGYEVIRNHKKMLEMETELGEYRRLVAALLENPRCKN